MLQGSYSKLSELWRAITGALSFTGESSRASLLSRAYSGILSFAGDLAVTMAAVYSETRDGVLSLAGDISRIFSITSVASGAIDLAASLSKLFQGNRTYSSGVSFSGSVSGLTQMLYTGEDAGALSMAGAYVRQCLFFRTLNSTLEAVAPGGPEGEAANVFGFTYMDMTLRV